MERVTGIGGVFLRSRNPAALVAWYAEHLGLPVTDGYVIFPESRNTVWSPFSEDTEYWPSAKQGMVNLPFATSMRCSRSSVQQGSRSTTGSRTTSTAASAGA